MRLPLRLRPPDAKIVHPVDDRYRAAMRRDLRTAARAAATALIVVLVLDGVLQGGELETLWTNVAGSILAAVVLLASYGPLRRRPDICAFAVGSIGLAAALQPITELTTVRYLMLAYFALLVVAMALFMPWDVRRHVSWLVASYTSLLLVVLSPLGAGLDAAYRDDALTIGLAAVVTSLMGHTTLERRRQRAFASEQQTRRLHRRAQRSQIELSRLNAELEVVSRVDPLTGVGNRLRLEEDVRAVQSALSRNGGVGAIALVDVDHFKLYNDEFGHLAGDQVLRALGATLGADLRAGDGVYRFGGEEFLLLLPGADLKSARGVVERLSRAIEGLAMPHPGNAPWGVVTISAGIAALGPGSDADAWLRSADSALYRAKASGRNATGLATRGRVRIFRPKVAQPVASAA
jgi:diguanylate cyclase (GGDEF)-like protein